MADFQVLPADFSATTTRVVCATTAAKERHCGAASLDIRKSALPDFAARMEAEGFCIELAA
jgi:hypothetical protein